jgi:hypothetical protein
MSGLKNRPSNFITSWLAAILVRTIVCRYVSYRRRILSRSGSYCPIAYRPVPTRLQYVLESLGCSLYSALLCCCTGLRSQWCQHSPEAALHQIWPAHGRHL